MIIIDKISPPAPFFTRKEPPTSFKTTLQEQNYWAKEKQYWTEGYNQDINGMLYWYATQIKLKDRVTGRLFYPDVRDVEVMIFSELKNSMTSGESPFIIKGRGVGLSSIGMNMPFYFFRTMPNTKCIATSRDKKTLATLFTDKTMIAYDELHPSIKFDLINKNQTANESFLKLGMSYLNEKKQERYAESEFVCRDTQDSEKAATNFSGFGAIYGFADEAPLMPRFSPFFNSARECFMDHSQNKMVGLLLNGGTVEHTIKPEDVQRIQYVWTSGKTLNIKPLFIPATYGKHVTNGHSDHKRAKEEILRRRDELDKLPDKTDLIAYIKNNPLTIEEIFDFGSSSRWEDYTRERINIQVKEVLKNPPVITSWNLVELNGNMEAEPNPKSTIRILEHPKVDVKYVLGVDSTMSTDDTSGKSGNSNFSLTVMKGIDPQSDLQFAPVASFNERPRNFDETFDRAIRLLKYYNKFDNAKCTGELNATGGVFVERVIKQGLKKTVLARRDLKKTGWVDTDKPWFTRVDPVMDWQYMAANTYFKKYAEMVKFLNILQDAQKGDNENTDDLDSFMACLYGFGTGDLLEDIPKKKSTYKMWVIVGHDENGVPQWEEKEYEKRR